MNKRCPKCRGTGTIWLMASIHGEDICDKCNGIGIVKKNIFESLLSLVHKQEDDDTAG